MTLGVSAGAASLTVSMALAGVHEPRLADFATAFLVVAAVCFSSLPLSLLMPRDAARELSGHPGHR
jgi:hypothetical protein